MMSGSADTPARDCSSAPEVVAGAAWYTLYTEGDDLFDAMLAAIRKARHRVWLATYIFAADDVGRRFVEALGERARAGVDVRLTVDALGSFLLFPRRLENALCGQGVKVRRYHRWHWREPMRYNRRDHRKLLVVDEEEAFLGGFNIHRQGSRHAPARPDEQNRLDPQTELKEIRKALVLMRHNYEHGLYEGEEYQYWQKVNTLKEKINLLTGISEAAIDCAAKTLLNLHDNWDRATNEGRKILVRTMIQEAGCDFSTKRIVWIKPQPAYEILFRLIDGLEAGTERRYWLKERCIEPDNGDMQED